MDDKTKARVLRRARVRLRLNRRRVMAVAGRHVTTGTSIAGYRAVQSLGVVTAEVVRVADLLENVAADLRDGIGGRSRDLEKVIAGAREDCLLELRMRAHAMGANAIFGARLDVVAPTRSTLIVVATGTSVIVERDDGATAAGATTACETCGASIPPGDEPTSEPTCPQCAAGTDGDAGDTADAGDEPGPSSETVS